MATQGARVLFLSIVCVSLAVASGAQARSILKSICLDDALLEMKMRALVEVPIGCELIDCCVGCPAGGPIDLRMSVEGEAASVATIDFEGLRPGTRLSLEGDGYLHGTSVVVRDGEALVRGVPVRGQDGVPIASIGLDLDPDVIERLRSSSGSTHSSIVVAVDQMVGRNVVDDWLVTFMVHPCSERFDLCDRIEQMGKLGSDASAIMLDGRRGLSCTDDAVLRSNGTVSVANVKAKAGCNSEIAVFAESNAVELVSPVDDWTDACGDTVAVALDQSVEIPVNIWLVRSGAAASAADHAANAKLLYLANKSGITFDMKIQDKSDDLGLKVKTLLACGAVSSIKGSGPHVKDELNAYYVPDVFTYNGANCDDRNFIFIGTGADDATLSHEIGHALSLFGESDTWGHTNDVPGFTKQNVMWGGSSEMRDHLSLGQVFRFSLDPTSMLNANGHRNGVLRRCPAKTTTDTCPALQLDWSRP